MSNGLSSTGFQVKSSEDILLDLQTDLKNRFGSTYALDSNTEDGAFLEDLSDLYSEIWVTCGKTHNSLSPSLARDVSLSKLVQFNGITRNPRKPTNTLLTIVGVPFGSYDKGLLVNSSSGGDQYVITEDFIIDITGSIRVEAEAVEFDTLVLPSDTLTVFDIILPDLYSVTNLDATILGTSSETDEELLFRRNQIIKQGAVGTNGAVEAALNGILNMRDAKVIDNSTNSVDAFGIGAYGVIFLVAREVGLDAGELVIWEDSIVNAIRTNKSMNSNMAQQLAGFVTKNYRNAQDTQIDVEYHLATEVDIHIIVNTTTLGKVAFFPPDGDELIKEAIVNYSIGKLLITKGFNIGEDVHFSELYIPIYSIPGHTVTSITIGTSASPVASIDIPIGDFEISQFDTTNIIVNVTP